MTAFNAVRFRVTPGCNGSKLAFISLEDRKLEHMSGTIRCTLRFSFGGQLQLLLPL